MGPILFSFTPGTLLCVELIKHALARRCCGLDSVNHTIPNHASIITTAPASDTLSPNPVNNLLLMVDKRREINIPATQVGESDSQ